MWGLAAAAGVAAVVLLVVVALLPALPETSPGRPRGGASSPPRDAVRPAGPAWTPPVDDSPAARAAASAAAAFWGGAEERAWDRLRAGDWWHAIHEIAGPAAEPHLRHARPSRLGPIEDEILARAAPDRPPGAALHLVARTAVARAEAPGSARDSREDAGVVLRWATSRALAEFAADARTVARAYRRVRFGPGTGPEDESSVRTFRFGEAAARVERARTDVVSWWAERRILRTAERLRGLAEKWDRALRELAEAVRKDEGRTAVPVPPDASPGVRAALDPTEPPDADGFVVEVSDGPVREFRRFSWCDPSPAVAAETAILPFLPLLEGSAPLRFAQVYAELGEIRIADACVRRCEQMGAVVPQALRDEIAALREVAGIVPGRRPSDVREHPDLPDWAQRHRTTDAAWTLDGRTGRDLGEFGDVAVRAYVDGGVLWAPEQWDEVAAREARASPGEREGLAGWVVESERWDVFTDVSARFAAESSVVLDAAYEQANLVLGAGYAPHRLAVIYSRRADFVARFRDGSGGNWVPAENTVHCFLDDPAQREFSEFPFPILVHEAAHASLDAACDGWSAPRWLHEGIACYFERWNPARSVRANRAETGTSLRRARALRAAASSPGGFPTLDSLLAIRRGWDVDDFGPQTHLRYATAESFLVHLMADPRRRRLVAGFVEDVRSGADPAARLAGKERADLERTWRESVLGRAAGER